MIYHNINTLPKNFDWREELKNVNGLDTFDDLGEEMDQGECGDCYSFA